MYYCYVQWSKLTLKVWSYNQYQIGILHSTSRFYSLELQSVLSLVVECVAQSRTVHSHSWRADYKSYWIGKLHFPFLKHQTF